MRLFTLLPVMTLAATQLAAQARPDSPEAAAERYVSAMRTHRWTVMADLMHPEALAKFRAMFNPMVHSPRGATVREQLFGGATPERLDSMSDGAFYAQVLKLMMEASPELQSMMDSAQTEVLGHVSEAPDLSHVVYRLRLAVGPVTVAKPDVLTFKRYRNDWMMLLRADLEIMAAALQQRFGT